MLGLPQSESSSLANMLLPLSTKDRAKRYLLKPHLQKFAEEWEKQDNGIGDGPTLEGTGLPVNPGHVSYFEGAVFHSGEAVSKEVYEKLEGDKCSYKLFLLYQPLQNKQNLPKDYQFRRAELYQEVYGTESKQFRYQYLFEKIKSLAISQIGGGAPTYESLLPNGSISKFEQVQKNFFKVNCFD
jgi:hypothetical protein